MTDKENIKSFSSIVGQWSIVLGVPQATLGAAAGMPPQSFNRAIANTDKGTLPSTRLINKLAKVISSITQSAKMGNNPTFSLVVPDKDQSELIETSYTEAAIPLRDVTRSLKGEVAVKDIVKGTATHDPDAFWDKVLLDQQREWIFRVSAPSHLLVTNYSIVPFHGRKQEMNDLESWAKQEMVLGLRLYIGFGGMGKTRLALEACSRLQQGGFTCGFLDYDLADTLIEYLRQEYQVNNSKKVLLVLDYAETHYQTVARILKVAATLKGGHLRILLLSRDAGEDTGDWWEEVKQSHGSITELVAQQCPKPINLGHWL